MNKVILLGRLTRDPEVRYTNSGKVVTSFTLAVDRPYSDVDGKREADFINCVLWGKNAETLGNCVNKGQRVLVEGRIQVRNYDAKDGSKRYATEVIADRFEFIERKNDGNGADSHGNRAQGNENYTGNGDASGQYKKTDTGNMQSFGTAVPFDEEIPF